MTEREWHSPIVDDEIAEPWRRLVGFVIDWMILVMIALILVSVLRIDLGERDGLRLPASVLIVQGLVAAAYYIGFTVSRGQTPGKMLIGTRVVMERTGANGPDPRSRFVRPALGGARRFCVSARSQCCRCGHLRLVAVRQPPSRTARQSREDGGGVCAPTRTEVTPSGTRPVQRVPQRPPPGLGRWPGTLAPLSLSHCAVRHWLPARHLVLRIRRTWSRSR